MRVPQGRQKDEREGDGEILSPAEAGLAKISADFPRLTPWATFCRPLRELTNLHTRGRVCHTEILRLALRARSG
jgi:hypothetical protein